VFLESARALEDGYQHGRFLNENPYGPLKWTISRLRDTEQGSNRVVAVKQDAEK
jgi:hypothetical protein